MSRSTHVTHTAPQSLEPAGIRTIWTLPAGEHGTTGACDNRMAMRLETAEAEV